MSSRATSQLCQGFVPLCSDQDLSCVLLTWVGCRALQKVTGDGAGDGPAAAAAAPGLCCTRTGSIVKQSPSCVRCWWCLVFCRMHVGLHTVGAKEAWPRCRGPIGFSFRQSAVLDIGFHLFKVNIATGTYWRQKHGTLSFILVPSDGL